MNVLKVIALSSLLAASSAFAADMDVSTVVSKGEVHVKITGLAAQTISETMTNASVRVTGNPHHYTRVATGKNLSCVTSSGFAYVTTCKFKVDADGLMDLSAVEKETVATGSAKVKVLNKVASVTISGKAGVVILKAMKNLVGHGTMSTTKSSDDISCSMLKDFSTGTGDSKGSCRFNLDAFGSASSKY